MNSQAGIAVALNIAGSVFFALLFALTGLLTNVSGTEIYGWRMLFTFPALTLLVLNRGGWFQIVAIVRRVRVAPGFGLTRLLSAALIGFQLWLFVWAPGNGYALAVSLGYFAMPIGMVVIGRIAFKDRLSTPQKAACLFALIGVINQFVVSPTLAWPIWAVALGYPVYFWLRRRTGTDHIGGLWCDMALSLPLSIWFIVQGGAVIGPLEARAGMMATILGLGVVSALGLGCQSLSAPYLNLSLFGLLVYVEPVLLLIVALLFGDTIAPTEWPTYIAIWLAVLMLMAEGITSLRKQRSGRERQSRNDAIQSPTP